MEFEELKRRTAASVVWSLVRVGWGNATTLVIFACLTRLLTPATFGIYALATFFVELTRIVAQAGLSDAIIREPEVDEELASTVFWANLGLGFVVGLVILLVAEPYARLMHEPQIAPVLDALAILVPITSLGGIHNARKLREFGHKAVAARAMAASTLAGAVAVGVAFRGGGVWSLVAQAAVVDVVGLAFAWSTFPWRPRLRFTWTRLKPVLAFSTGIMGSQLLWLVMARMPELIIGRTTGAAAVGIYRVAYRIIDFVSQAVLQPVSSVALVTLARLQDQRERFNSAYMRIVGVVSLAIFPVLFGLGAAAPDAVHVLFGGKWDASAPVSTVLSLIALPLTLNYFVAPALSAKGESRMVLQLSVLQVVATAALMLLAAPFGLMAVAAAYVVRLYLTMPVSQWALNRRAGIPVLSAVRALAAPVAASVVMTAAVVGVRLALGGEQIAPIARLACQVAAGAVVYVLTLAVIARPVLADHAEVALRMVRRAAPGAPRFAGGSRGS